MTESVFTPELLDRCISCGFCLPACPTYALTQDEASSPRGRITLMRAVQTGRLPLTEPEVADQSSFCLGCRACEVVCPAGVRYGALLEEWRDAGWQGRRKPVRLRALLFAARQRRAVALLGRLRRAARTGRDAGAGDQLLLGCFERLLYPEVSRAALNLVPELTAPAGQGCCGALHAHNGELERGRAMARRLGESVAGSVVTTSGGCAAHLADVLGRDRVAELSERLVAGADPPRVRRLTVDGRPMRVALQDSCHLRNGLGVYREPRELLARIAEYVEVPGAERCCGAAGTYSLLRPADSKAVLGPKLDALEAAGVDVVVVVNPGCLRQLRTGLRARRSSIRVVHLAELVGAAYSIDAYSTGAQK